MYVKKSLMLWLAVLALALPLSLAGTAGAMYLSDATKVVSAGTYTNPNDGMCVIGVAADGTMLIDTSIKNNRDCSAYTRNANGALDLTTMTTATSGAACTTPTSAFNLAVGGKNYKYAYSATMCLSSSGSNTHGLSRAGLDSSYACAAVPATGILGLGGVAAPSCTAFGWTYMNKDASGNLPTGTAVPGYTNLITTKARSNSDNLGFCYASMRMNDATHTVYSANTSTGCPSYHNTASLAGATEWPACASSATGCQTQASYDAGLGWGFTSPNCTYSYGQKGILNSNLTSVGTGTYAQVTLCSGSTGTAVTGTCVDLTGITTQGDCAAIGASWDNWLSQLPGQAARTVITDSINTNLPTPTQIVKLDATTSVASGGGNFITGTGQICTKCHTDQSRSTAWNTKPGHFETGHRRAGDTGGPWSSSFTAATSAWGLQGVQCTVCHAGGKPAGDDLLQVSATTGVAKATGGHNQTVYAKQSVALCFGCHGTVASATTVPVSSGTFANTAKGLAPIANQFLASPHAKYVGTNSLVSIQTQTSYTSNFAGFNCISSATATIGTVGKIFYWDGSAVQQVPFLDSLTNSACTTTQSSRGYVGMEGSGATNYGGNCMTCHDVHWSLDSTNPVAKPMRRDCTTCHVDPGTQAASASSAPQVVVANINHPTGTGTPFDATKYPSACETCHMAAQAAVNGTISAAAHIFRISTDPAYTTMGTTQVNTDATGSAWVDVDLACGQCHGGSGGTTATHNGAPYFTKTALASGAANMHIGGLPVCTSTVPVVSHGTVTQTGYVVSFTDSSTDSGDTSKLDAVTVNWGDGTATDAGIRGSVFTHTYTGRARTVSIVHMVRNSCDTNVYAKEIIKQTVPVRYNVTGTVFQSNGSTAITSATVVLRVNGHTRQMTTSDGAGAFTFTNVLPGSYAIHVYKSGVTFGADVPVTVTTANVPQNVTSVTP
jgi:hypothetical protein